MCPWSNPNQITLLSYCDTLAYYSIVITLLTTFLIKKFVTVTELTCKITLVIFCNSSKLLFFWSAVLSIKFKIISFWVYVMHMLLALHMQYCAVVLGTLFIYLSFNFCLRCFRSSALVCQQKEKTFGFQTLIFH